MRILLQLIRKSQLGQVKDLGGSQPPQAKKQAEVDRYNSIPKEKVGVVQTIHVNSSCGIGYR